MSREKAFAQARLLSKEQKSEVVVYLGHFGYGYTLSDEYNGNILNIQCTFSDGFILE